MQKLNCKLTADRHNQTTTAKRKFSHTKKIQNYVYILFYLSFSLFFAFLEEMQYKQSQIVVVVNKQANFRHALPPRQKNTLNSVRQEANERQSIANNERRMYL